MTVREQINADLSVLSEAELQQVANYLASLKFQAKKPTNQKTANSEILFSIWAKIRLKPAFPTLRKILTNISIEMETLFLDAGYIIAFR